MEAMQPMLRVTRNDDVIFGRLIGWRSDRLRLCASNLARVESVFGVWEWLYSKPLYHSHPKWHWLGVKAASCRNAIAEFAWN